MTEMWNDALTNAIRKLRKRTLSGEDSDAKVVAEATQGLPVYSDLGGYLAIREDGEIVRFNPENTVTLREEDERWRMIARAVAAERFAELASLRPARPSIAQECSACGGTGRVFDGRVRCGTCFGLGWLA